MLSLKNIVKEYRSGDTKVQALKGISIDFREHEFVSILGQSGCGKTTTLNIIGGLDHYTSGDLIINGKSTKEFKDRDWDTYRNHSVGFVFQSYNLIPHQSVLANVELALTLSGVSKKERRERAMEALKKVGLGDQMHKRPNQMSGGQMQRVAIARALVNDPDIILADEPTGALDTETSIQIMEILKNISKDKLIIMVTHNPELAQQYSSRIIKLLDGKIVDDSNPYEQNGKEQEKQTNKKKASMFIFYCFVTEYEQPDDKERKNYSDGICRFDRNYRDCTDSCIVQWCAELYHKDRRRSIVQLSHQHTGNDHGYVEYDVAYDGHEYGKRGWKYGGTGSAQNLFQ